MFFLCCKNISTSKSGWFVFLVWSDSQVIFHVEAAIAYNGDLIFALVAPPFQQSTCPTDRALKILVFPYWGEFKSDWFVFLVIKAIVTWPTIVVWLLSVIKANKNGPTMVLFVTPHLPKNYYCPTATLFVHLQGGRTDLSFWVEQVYDSGLSSS